MLPRYPALQQHGTLKAVRFLLSQETNSQMFQRRIFLCDASEKGIRFVNEIWYRKLFCHLDHGTEYQINFQTQSLTECGSRPHEVVADRNRRKRTIAYDCPEGGN